MTKAEKQAAIESKTVGYWSVLGGVELKRIEYGITDYAVCVTGTFAGKPSVHRLKVRFGDYVVLYGNRLYFADCIRA